MVLRFFLIMAPVIFFCTTTAYSAGGAYVTDTFKISLRRGPSIENKILEFLPSGKPVNILEEKDGWSRIVITKPDNNTVTGWVLTRYLVHRLPWKDKSGQLIKELARVKMNLDSCRSNLEKVSKREQALSQIQIKFVKTVDTLQKDYEALKRESADYLTMKAECELYKETAMTAKKENERLKNLNTMSFFGLGAFVLLSGLAIGVMIGRMNQKRSSFSEKLIL